MAQLNALDITVLSKYLVSLLLILLLQRNLSILGTV